MVSVVLMVTVAFVVLLLLVRRGWWRTRLVQLQAGGIALMTFALQAFMQGNADSAEENFPEATAAVQRARELDPKCAYGADRPAEVARQQHAAKRDTAGGRQALTLPVHREAVRAYEESPMLGNIVACILAGGEGTRLLPLTVHRTKPAVRFGGSYRLIDLTLSNCVNSDIRQMLVFPQSQARALEDHLRQGWSFLSQERDAYIRSIPPPQVGRRRYRGTADAVYQNLSILERIDPAHVLILGSDHVYQMDYRHLLQFHQARGADVTVATFPVPRHQASQFGIVTADALGEVTAFLEKPSHENSLPTGDPAVLASMGIYLFRFAVLREVLGEDAQRRSTHDFGREILPGMLGRYRVAAFPFVEGIAKAPAYWRDVGTIDAYWEAHMDLLGPGARFQLSPPHWPLRTTHAQAPPTTFGPPDDFGAGQGGGVTNSIIAPGCQLQGGRVERAILSPGVWIEAEAEVQESILCDGVHIGRGAQVRRTILDHGTVVPPGARIGVDLAADGDQFTVSDGGITVVGYASRVRALASL